MQRQCVQRVAIGNDIHAHEVDEGRILCTGQPLASLSSKLKGPAPKGAPLCDRCARVRQERGKNPLEHCPPVQKPQPR
jgi:hypothetical protein